MERIRRSFRDAGDFDADFVFQRYRLQIFKQSRLRGKTREIRHHVASGAFQAANSKMVKGRGFQVLAFWAWRLWQIAHRYPGYLSVSDK